MKESIPRKLMQSLLVAIAVSVVGCNQSASTLSSSTSDRKPLISLYHNNKETLEELVKMVYEDKDLTRVAEDWTRPDNPGSIGVSQARISRYRELFRKSGIQHGVEAVQKDEVVEFIVSTTGFSLRGSTKGIAYVKNPKYLTVMENLDALPTPPSEGDFFERIEGNWYIFYDISR